MRFEEFWEEDLLSTRTTVEWAVSISLSVCIDIISCSSKSCEKDLLLANLFSSHRLEQLILSEMLISYAEIPPVRTSATKNVQRTGIRTSTVGYLFVPENLCCYFERILLGRATQLTQTDPELKLYVN